MPGGMPGGMPRPPMPIPIPTAPPRPIGGAPASPVGGPATGTGKPVLWRHSTGVCRKEYGREVKGERVWLIGRNFVQCALTALVTLVQLLTPHTHAHMYKPQPAAGKDYRLSHAHSAQCTWRHVESVAHLVHYMWRVFQRLKDGIKRDQ